MTIPKELEMVVQSNVDILGGTPCFKGTRVPIETFLDYVGAGYSLDRFLVGFPSVSRDHATVVLEWVAQNSKHVIGLDIAS